MSGLVPCSKLSVIVMLPSLSLSDEKYSRRSMPDSCCSITCTTVLCTVSAETPRIGHGDLDGGRRDARILRDRQSNDGDGARHHQDDGHHPGEDRAFDEELGHGDSWLWLQRSGDGGSLDAGGIRRGDAPDVELVQRYFHGLNLSNAWA